MGSKGRFAAQLIETSASGFAGLTASLLLDRHPGIASRYEPDALASWQGQLQHWLHDLSAALDTAEGRLFVKRMLWNRKLFVSRQAPVEDLEAALVALRDVLVERLPADAADVVATPLEQAIEAVAADGSGDAAKPEGRTTSRPALLYLESILEGRPREAIDRVLTDVDGGAGARQRYLEVLLPAQREAGRMWIAGELGIAEEHLITVTTQRAMTLLCERARSTPPNGKTVLLACVAGNVHDIGLRAIADLCEMAGWRSIHLGADVPGDEIARAVRGFEADLLVLAATLDPHLKSVQQTIERVRSLAERQVKIIVGGPVFDSLPELWRKVGADGHAARVEDAEPLGSRLTG